MIRSKCGHKSFRDNESVAKDLTKINQTVSKVIKDKQTGKHLFKYI